MPSELSEYKANEDPFQMGNKKQLPNDEHNWVQIAILTHLYHTSRHANTDPPRCYHDESCQAMGPAGDHLGQIWGLSAKLVVGTR